MEKKFYCKFCDFRTIREYNFKDHLKKNHSNIENFNEVIKKAEESWGKEFSAMQKDELKERYEWNDFCIDEAVEVVFQYMTGVLSASTTYTYNVQFKNNVNTNSARLSGDGNSLRTLTLMEIAG